MSGDQNPPDAPGKSAPVTSQNKVSLSELIAKTPGAQTREQLLERIKARQKKRSKEPQKSAPIEDQLATPEPLPFINKPDGYAADLFERLKAKQKPPKRPKPRIVVNNDKPKPSDKK